jgi:hypothetical protein
MEVKTILDKARSYIGIKESPTNSNNVIFNTRYYGKPVSGSAYPWCVAFQWCLFQDVGASDIFYGGNKVASCTLLKNYHKANGQEIKDFTSLKPGDLVFFNFSANKVTNSSTTEHIGICEEVSGNYVTTIDGNTGTTNEANGGAVMRRKRHKKYFVTAIRPKYLEVEEMTQDEFNKMFSVAMDKYISEKAKKNVDKWAKESWEVITDMKIMDGTRPLSDVTRQEIAEIIKKTLVKAGAYVGS